jgi:hypothetical protein
MFTSHDQSQSHNNTAANTSDKNVVLRKDTHKCYMQDEIKSEQNSQSALYHSVQNILLILHPQNNEFRLQYVKLQTYPLFCVDVQIYLSPLR